MSKLFKLKKWMTVNDAAVHISNVVGETVCEADIYRLALDGHLTLSVNFVNQAKARMAEIVKTEDVEFVPWKEISKLKCPEKLADMLVAKNGEEQINENEWMRLSLDIVTIDDVWDLAMIGNEQLDIEHKYQALTGGPGVTNQMLCGVFVRRGDQLCNLQEKFTDSDYREVLIDLEIALEMRIKAMGLDEKEAMKLKTRFADGIDERKERNQHLARDNPEWRDDLKLSDHYPAGGLPEDAVLVVRTDEITRFIQSLEDKPNQEPTDKPLHPKERITLLVLIAAMSKEMGIDYTKRGVSSAYVKMTQSLGARVGDDTIREIVKALPDAVDRRSQ